MIDKEYYPTLQKGVSMKKMDEIIHDIDVKIDKKMTPVWGFMQKYFVIFSGTFLGLLMLIFLLRVLSDRTYVLTAVIGEDLVNIERIFNQIDKECNILDIRKTGAQIDFLNVEKFSGSTIGPINLAHPKNWKGPYLIQNPAIQQKFYEIVLAHDGYFIVPGQGVELPNGLVMGKDIVITKDTAVTPMLLPDGSLHFKGQACAAKLDFKVGDWDSGVSKIPAKPNINELDSTLKEFNDALSYAQLSSHEDVQTC